METQTSFPPTTSTKPVAHVRLGRISASIWENPGPNGPRYAVTFERRYQDAEGWKSSQSYSGSELLMLAKVADKAHDEVMRLRSERG